MLAYRGLFLAAAISSAGIALADVFVQPNYRYQGDEQSYPHQVVQQQERFPKQVINQPYATGGIRTTYPYQVRSQLVGYPAHHYYHSSPHRLHIAKIGGHDRVRPSLYVGYRPNSVVHHHRKRSAESTLDETSVSTKNNAVATESSLGTHPIDPVIDPHLTNDQSIDTNDKHVKNRQSKDVRAVNAPLLLGLYPDRLRQVSSTYLPKKLPLGEHSNEESMARSAKPILSETMQQMVPTNSHQDKMAYSENDGQRIKELTDVSNSVEMISTSKMRSLVPDNFYTPFYYDGIYDMDGAYGPYPLELYDLPPNPYAPVDPYLAPYPYLRMNSHSTVDPYLNAYATNPNYPIYKYQNSGARSNLPLITDTVQTSPCMLQVHQLSSAGNWWDWPEEYYALS